MKPAILVALTVVFLASCQSAPQLPDANAPSEIFFQRAQAASDQNQYDEALTIYRSFLADRPDASREDRFSARYEIAFLEYKKGLIPEATKGFEELLADYADLDKSSGAPGWVKVLSQKKLQEIKDKAAKNKTKG